MGAWAGGPPTPVRFHDAKCQACAGSAPTCDAASFLPEGKIGRRTVVPNVHALAMLSESEIKRIGPCVVPGEKAKASARPQASMECNCAARQSGGSAPPRSTAHSASLRTSDCGTFDPCASSNVSFAPIVLKKSAAQLFGCCRESGARELGCFQAGIGTGNGMSFANFRRF